MTPFSFFAIKKSHYTIFMLLLSVAIVCLIVVSVPFFTDRGMPDGMDEVIIFCGLGLFIFSAAAIIYYFQKRFEITIDSFNHSIQLIVNDKTLGVPLVIQQPFTLHLQWIHEETGSRIKSKRLYVTMVDLRGEPIITFTGALGAAQSAPPEFDYVEMHERGNLRLAPLIYSTGKVKELSPILAGYAVG